MRPRRNARQNGARHVCHSLRRPDSALRVEKEKPAQLQCSDVTWHVAHSARLFDLSLAYAIYCRLGVLLDYHGDYMPKGLYLKFTALSEKWDEF